MEFGKSSFEKWTPVPNLGNRFDVSDVGWGLGDIVFTFVCTYVVVTIIMFFVLLLRSKIKKKK